MRRLSPALLTVAMLAVVGLLVALYVGKKLLARDDAPPSDPVLNVPMALTDLKPGTRLTEAHLGMGPTRRPSITRDIVQTNRVLIGRVVKNSIQAAQPISTLDLYPPGENAPLAIQPGMRAVSVEVGSSTAAAVGQYVDVHFTPTNDPDAEQTGGQILTLFKGVKILELSTPSSATSSFRGTSEVTLELSPEQANIILLAKDRGTLNLVYTPEGKGRGGVAVNDQDRATLYQILGYVPKPPVEPAPPYTTEQFTGSGRRIYQFRDGVRTDVSGSGSVDSGDSNLSAPPRSDPINNVPSASARVTRS